MLLKVSPTLLESYRLYIEQDWMTTESLIESVSGQFVPTDIVNIGTDFHRMLEGLNPIHGSVFDMESFYQHRYVPYGVNEVRLRRPIDTDYGSVLVSAQCDVLSGLTVHENKTSFKTFQADKYNDSVQWRCYLYVFGATSAQYHCYKLLNKKDGIVTQERNDLVMYPYPTMVRHITEYINGLIDFCHSQGLIEHITIQEAA